VTKPRPRPPWWTPEGVIDRLRDGAGPAAVKAAARAECPGLSERAAELDLRRWAGHPRWALQLKEVLALFVEPAAGQKEDVLSDAWHPRFLEAMEAAQGRVADACQKTGLPLWIVTARRDRKSRHFRADFAAAVRDLEMGRYGQIRETYLDAAEAGDTAAAGKLLAAVLPELHAPRKEINVSGRLDGFHTHLVVALPPSVVEASALRTAKLLNGRQAAPPSLPCASDITSG
jgi:hypothetical protein